MSMRITASVVLLILGFAPSAFAAMPSSVLVVQWSAEPTQFDPLMMEDGTALKLAANVLATPYEYDGQGNLRMALLQSASVSKDQKQYTLKFRKNLKWSDGVRFHADQFMLALRRLTHAKVKPALSELFPRIDLAHSRVLDAQTVQIRLFEKDALFFHWCSLPSFAPIREDFISRYEKKRSPVVPTLAAYEVVDYQRDAFLMLKKNPEFYDQNEVNLTAVKVRFVGDEGALLPLFRAGAIDILNKVPVLQFSEVKSEGHLVEVPVEAVTYLGFNTAKPPFQEVKNRRQFREALRGHLDELAQVLKTGERGANVFLPEVLWPPGFRVEAEAQGAAKAEVQKLNFIAQSDQGSRNQTLMEWVQARVANQDQWKMNLNILEWATHYSKIKIDPDPVFRFGWQNPVSDPYVLYQVLRCKSANNFTGWCNAKYDELIAALRQETRLVKKAALVKAIEKILIEEAPVLPLLHQVLRFAYSKRVFGFRANPFGVILFRELRLNEKTI